MKTLAILEVPIASARVLFQHGRYRAHEAFLQEPRLIEIHADRFDIKLAGLTPSIRDLG